MPDKRQTSKQRRAARNRASRDALAARRTNAVTSAPPSGSSRASSAASASGGSATATTAGIARGGAGGLLGARGNRRPGDLAVLAALGLAIVSAVSVLFFVKVRVDDRGEPLPNAFRAVAVTAREAITGEQLPDTKATLIDAYGPGILLAIALPVVVAAFAFWANRRPNRARLLMYSLVAMAVVVLFSGGIGPYFFPSLIALAVATFQVRKADMPARVAERVAPTRGRRVIDAKSEEVEDAAVEDDADRDAGEADGGDARAGDEAAVDDDADPLAELEAEMEAEERARRAPGDHWPRRSTSEE